MPRGSRAPDPTFADPLGEEIITLRDLRQLRARERRALNAPHGRLLTDEQAADYLGTSRSYIRAQVANGVLKRIELPATDGRNGRARMLRIDVRDLDALVDRMKG